MSSLTLRRPTPSLTLEIPKSSRRFPSSFSSPSLPSDRFSPFGLDSSYFDSISPVKRSQVQIREEVEETSHSFKRPIPNLPPSPTRGLPKQANDQLSSPKNKKEQEPNELPPFEDEVSALIKTELLIASLKQRRQLGEGQPAWVDFEPRLVKSLAVGIFLPTPLDSNEFNHHALLMSLETQDPTFADRIHSDGLGPVNSGGFRFSYQRDAFRNSRGIMKIVELKLGKSAVGKTDQDIKNLSQKVPLPARPYTSCQDYLIWLLVMLETSSILCEGEVARFNSMNLKGHLKP